MVLGEEAGEYFCPVINEPKRPVTAERLREAIADKGYQILHGLDAGLPVGEEARAWSEYGEFDSLGHKLQGKLAGRIDEQLDLVVDRILHLLEAGWRKVRVVTDHGWLLAPGGLPALPLKKYMTECRWARCAVIKEGGASGRAGGGLVLGSAPSGSLRPGRVLFRRGDGIHAWGA